MKKMVVCLFVLFVFQSFLLAASNTFTLSLGNYKMSSLIITKMEHAKKLFRYEDPVKLKKYLEQENSNLSAINVFYIDTGKNKILFDAGTDPDVLTERLQEINVNPKDINFICITHMHFDHIGGLVKNGKKVFPNATVFVAKEELEANPNSILSEFYKNNIKTFKQNEVVIDNIKTIPAFGHTKGHSMFLVSGKNKSVLIWGDMLHAVVQFDNFNIYMTYDAAPDKVIILRKKVLEEFSKNNCYIAGAHLIYPGIGTIEKTKTGYKFMPAK